MSSTESISCCDVNKSILEHPSFYTFTEHQKGFLISVQKKLGNERFVANAKPEVIDLERKKQADAEARIQTIEESLASM